MLTNQYTAFGNSMLHKYAGMVSAINPLSLFYLKNETKEEQEPAVQLPSVTYVQNRIQNISHHHYHTMANRYMINYQNTMNLIASNPVYSQNPNFRRDLMPAKLIHTQAPKSEEEAKEETKEIIKTLVKQLVSEYKETLIKEQDNHVQVQNFLTVLSENTSLQRRILPVLEKNIHTIWVKHEKESEKEIVKEMTVVLKEVMEQAAQKLPDQYKKRLTAQRGQNLRMQAQEIITQKEVIYLAEAVTRQMTVKTEEIRKQNITEISKVTEKTQITDVRKKETAVHSMILQHMNMQQGFHMQNTSAVPHITAALSVQQKQRIGKERFQTQVMGRISPLPVRPTALFFPKEKQTETEDTVIDNKEKTDAGIIQKINYVMKKETSAEHKYYTHLLERFLQKDETVRTQEIDRSRQPAGIIWHQKPKENVRFERREVLLVPMNLVHDTAADTVSTDANKDTVGTGTAKQSTAGTNIVNTKVSNQYNVNELSVYTNVYGDYRTRQLVRRTVPDFTKTQNLISVFETAGNGNRDNSTSQVTYTWKNEMLELVLPKASMVTDSEDGIVNFGSTNTKLNNTGSVNTSAALLQKLVIVPQKEQISAYSAGSAAMPHAAAYAASNQVANNQIHHAQFAPVVGPNAHSVGFTLPDAYSAPGPAPIAPAVSAQSTAANRAVHGNPASTAPISPVSLVYKQENDSNSQQQQEIKKIEEKTEFLEDIVFEKKVITKDTKYTYHTGNEAEQDTQMISQMPGGINGPSAGSTTVSRAEVDNIVSESVSRQMDLNIPRISKQVYKDIERQLKKERERRGIR